MFIEKLTPRRNKYLAAHRLFGVEMGKRGRGTTLRAFVTMFDAVTAGLYWAEVSNPYPWVSGSGPVATPQAFTGRAPDRYGLMVSLRARLFPRTLHATVGIRRRGRSMLSVLIL
jgi:hypothetical protein